MKSSVSSEMGIKEWGLGVAFLLGMPTYAILTITCIMHRFFVMFLEENNEGVDAFRHLNTQNVSFFCARVGSGYAMSLIHLIPVVHCRTTNYEALRLQES